MNGTRSSRRSGRPSLFDEEMCVEFREISDLAVDDQQALNVWEADVVARDIYKKHLVLRKLSRSRSSEPSASTLDRLRADNFDNSQMARTATARRNEAERDIRNYISVVAAFDLMKAGGAIVEKKHRDFPAQFMTNFDATTVVLSNATPKQMRVLVTKNKKKELKEVGDAAKRTNERGIKYFRLKLHALTSADGHLNSVVAVIRGKNHFKKIRQYFAKRGNPHFKESVFLPHYKDNDYVEDDEDEEGMSVEGNVVEGNRVEESSQQEAGDEAEDDYGFDRYDNYDPDAVIDADGNPDMAVELDPESEEYIFGRPYDVPEQKKYMKLLRSVYRHRLGELLGPEEDDEIPKVCLYFVPGPLPEKFIVEIIMRDHILRPMKRAKDRFINYEEKFSSPVSDAAKKAGTITNKDLAGVFQQIFSMDGDRAQIEVSKRNCK